MLLIVTAGLTMVRHQQQSYRMQLARADLYINPDNSWVESAVTYVEEALDPDDLLFVFGPEATYYFLTGHYYRPWRFIQVYPGQVGGNHGIPLARTLRANSPKLVIRGVKKWPGVPDVASYALALGRFTMLNYVSCPDFPEDDPLVAGSKPPVWVFDMLCRQRKTFGVRRLGVSAPTVRDDRSR